MADATWARIEPDRIRMKSMLLAGKIAIITGAASGMGQAVVK
jgi:hypothetical protein